MQKGQTDILSGPSFVALKPNLYSVQLQQYV